MLVYKMWKATRKTSWGSISDTWMKEGWFLFGFIPIYVRDVQNREKF